MKKDVIITIKVTEEERRELDRRRRGESRSEYIREVLFGENLISESGLTKAEEDTLKFTASTALLMRYLADSMGKKELVLEAKKQSETWFDKKYLKKHQE